MKVLNLSKYDATAIRAAIPVWSVGERELDGASVPDSLKALAKANNFNGEAGGFIANEDGVLYGIGDGHDPLVFAGAAEKLPGGMYKFAEAMGANDAALAAAAWAFGGYRFDRYKKQKPADATLIVPETIDFDAIESAAISNYLVRDLVNTPAGDMTPAALEEEARDLAKAFSASMTVIVGDDLLDKNFPMVHAVGRAADIAPRLIDIVWGDASAPKLTLVGKGVCFDSGGLNIKGGAGMALMKKDMGGSAHVLGLARMIMTAGLNVRLRVLVPAVENAISGNAFRPGDVLQSRKGITVEIGNTDAEGRLILGDALALGGEEKPDLMISMATLTGAARVAVGPDLAPFYTDGEPLAEALSGAANETRDPVWRLPLWPAYEANLNSSIADVNHIAGGSFAGSVIAALFLKKFVPDSTRWLHFDIYAWRPKAAPGRPIGAEVQAIRALFALLQKRYRA